MPNFSDFQIGPGGHMARKLAIPIDGCMTWTEFERAAQVANGEEGREDGRLCDKATALDGVLSSGERVLLQALLHAANFDALADRLAAGKTWDRMSSASGAHRDALIACISQID